MGWKDALRLSDIAFTELSLQAVYAVRQGNVPPSGPPRVVVAKARRRVVQSKALVAGFLVLMVAGGVEAMHLYARSQSIFSGATLPLPVFDTGVLTGLLSLDVAFLWWTGIQVLPTLLASGIFPVLEPLPIDERTRRRVALLLYLRLFDLPVVAVVVATPLLLGIALGPAAGLAILPGVLSAVAFSLALSLVTGLFFVRRIQGSRGGGGRAAARWAYLMLWLLPAFGMFGLLTAAPDFFHALDQVVVGATPYATAVWAIFPLSFAALPSLVQVGPAAFGLQPAGVAALVAATFGYVAIGGWSTVWLYRSIRNVEFLPALAVREFPAAERVLRPQTPVLAVLTKDLRVASRTPGYAFLVLLPVLDSVALGFFTYVDAPGPAVALALGLAAVTTAALLATFFGPAFFAIEVLAHSYGRTLPLTARSNVLAKTLLVALIYLTSAGIVLAFVSARIFDPALFGLFVLAELPAVAAAALLEFGLLFWRARRRAVPITNLYAGAWTAVLVSIPGLVVAGAPLVVDRLWGLPAMVAVAVAELGVLGPIALRRGVA